MIKEALDELDMDRIDEVLHSMEEYRYASGQELLLEQLQEAVMEYDVERCEDIIKEWRECL